MDTQTAISLEKIQALKDKVKANPKMTKPVHKRSKGGHKTIGQAEGTGQDYQYEGKECPYCGWCDDPDNCVWSIDCPKCGATQKAHCRGTNGRLEGLHQERWDEREKRYSETID